MRFFLKLVSSTLLDLTFFFFIYYGYLNVSLANLNMALLMALNFLEFEKAVL